MVRIITDSASDIDIELADNMGVTVVPMEISFGDEVYKDCYELSVEDFYKKLIESDEMPKTSQINPFTFEEVFDEVEKNGDSAVVILMSSKLSGTYQSAVMASAGDYENIYIVDSLNVTVGEQCLVLYALKLRDKGLSAKEIADEIDAIKGDVKVIALLNTLEYLKKGGRISASAALAGGLLSIKPVVAVENGEVVILGKARGSKNGNNMLRELIEKSGGIDFDMPILLGYTGLERTMLDKYVQDSRKLWEKGTSNLSVIRVGSTIGTHVGPGAIALGFIPVQTH